MFFLVAGYENIKNRYLAVFLHFHGELDGWMLRVDDCREIINEMPLDDNDGIGDIYHRI